MHTLNNIFWKKIQLNVATVGWTGYLIRNPSKNLDVSKCINTYPIWYKHDTYWIGLKIKNIYGSQCNSSGVHNFKASKSRSIII